MLRRPASQVFESFFGLDPPSERAQCGRGKVRPGAQSVVNAAASTPSAPTCVMRLQHIFAFAVLAACSTQPVEEVGADAPSVEQEAAEAAPDTCAERLPAPDLLANVSEPHLTLEYWLDALDDQVDLDEVLLDSAEVGSLNASFSHPDNPPLGRVDLSVAPVTDEVLAEVNDRVSWLLGKISEGDYVDATGAPVSAEVRAALAPRASISLRPELRVALDRVQVLCGPFTDPLYTPSLDLRFNRNNCSNLQAQDPVLVLEVAGDLLLIRSGYTTGWIPSDSPLSPVVPPELVATVVHGARAELRGAAAGVPAGGSVPIDGTTGAGVVATASGFDRDVEVPTTAGRAGVALTRRAVLTEAFRYLNTPYGWGGEAGGRDCSRFLMDVFETFGVELPRFSAFQAQAGSFTVDVSEVESERERELLIDAAARRGVALLHFPGHIMLYLGRDESGRRMAIHAFAEYLAPCSDPEEGGDVETLFEVDEVTVSDLNLGRGSSRTAFIERLTKITVIGGTPGIELDGVAQLRRAAPTATGAGLSCPGDDDAFLIVNPRVPNVRQPLRVIVTASENFGPVEIAFTDPNGERHTPGLRYLGGPPYTIVAEIAEPMAGDWSIAMGDGERIIECETVTVRSRPPADATGTGAVWEVRHNWSAGYENLYAAFVESIFDFPIEEDLTWTSLHELTANADRNILYDYYGAEEDSTLELGPDCADLPYMIRAYFAWKMGLPFGFRQCSRGRAGQPPRCENLQTNVSVTRADPVNTPAFQHFSRRNVRSGVHSASGRTHPDDEDTDYYPVAMTREALRPGTLYADPYGHLLIIAQWIPQGATDYGVLIGADAQPDGTVGRRRFWRGSFLFTPETTDVGAGFKAFRPLRWSRTNGEMTSFTNADLGDHADFAPYSLDQYAGTSDDFYFRMEEIINPRPLDPLAMLVSLVDALDESVSRRVNSVNNGEAYMADHNYREVEMPTGYSIFETSGAWEDFSTPSRDMRLLISIDTVRLFPERVRQAPTRYGLPESGEGLETGVGEIEAALAELLGSRTFDYIRSDDSTWTLSLADVVDRRVGFEMSYNPNDCSEIRWVALEGSDEYAPCDRHAPGFQRERMESYRAWFSDRQRPPR